MDLLEDHWWPTAITSSPPFSLPSSSKWLLKQESGFITFVTGGDNAVYRVPLGWLAFLMLLDMAQQMYLLRANSTDQTQSITFYKGVMFLDSLRQDVMAGIRNREADPPPFEKSLPDSMRRWLCRLILNIPHDPENRKKNAVVLQRAYEELDIFEYDFLDWSQTHEELLLGCLSKISNGLHGQCLYPVETIKWLSILRSQFVQAGLCTMQSLSRLKKTLEGEELQAPNEEGNNTPPVKNPDTDLINASIPDENAMHSGLEDKFATPELSPKEPRKRGRPRRQTQTIDTDRLKTETRRRLRSQRSAEAATDDAWFNLSQAPLITPQSPSKPEARPPTKNLKPGKNLGSLKKGMSKVVKHIKPINGATALNIQAPEIKPLVDGESAIENGGGLNEAKDKHQESKYASHFEYISTMASIEDAFFKTNIRKDLLKDRHVTWSAFKTLSPQLQHASATNWDILTRDIPKDNSSRSQTIKNLDKIYQKFKKSIRGP